MNIILLSGGSGKRLWPLSNEVYSKQFIRIFKTKNGYESMVQRVYRQIQLVEPDSVVIVATSRSQVAAIHNQLGKGVGISVEPCRRDTFAAIALAAAYLVDVIGVRTDEPVVVCPVDPYVKDDYFRTLGRMSVLVDESKANLVLMGIEPTYPSEKYGYIIPENKDAIATVCMFREKPDKDTADKYIEQGALWNGGVFACKLSYVLDKAEKLLGYRTYKLLYDNYEKLEKISFDYAVVEKEPFILVMRFAGEWKDIGTWNTLAESMDVEVIGDGRMDGSCRNVHIFNELDVPILAMGCTDMVIAASPEGILVSDKERSSYIKPYVDGVHGPVKFAEKSWGSYRVMDADDASLTVKVILKPGNRMNYHSHERRDETWTVISGRGRTVVDGVERLVRAGDVVTMPAGCRHTVIADTELKIIEVQMGRIYLWRTRKNTT